MVDDNDKAPPPPLEKAATDAEARDLEEIQAILRRRNPDFTNPPGVEEFPEKVSCNQCRRVFPAKSLRAKSNTLLTEAALICPRCRRKLHKMKLKEWYDRYVQGQEKNFQLDTHAFFHVDPPDQIPDGVIAERESREQQRLAALRAKPESDRRGGGRRGRGRNQGRNQEQRPDPLKPKPLLPQNVKSFRLPKKRRGR